MYIYILKRLEVEREFHLEFPDEAVERFKNLKDVVEFVSRSFYAI
jgi:acyl carrier protein